MSSMTPNDNHPTIHTRVSRSGELLALEHTDDLPPATVLGNVPLADKDSLPWFFVVWVTW